MRRLILPILLVAASIGAFRLSEQRGEQAVTATAAADLASPTTPLLSARRMPELLDQPRSQAAIELQLQEVAVLSPQLSCIAARSSDGTDLTSHNPGVGLVPASVQKLVTAAAALQQFGPDTRLRTVLATASQPVDGVIDGDAYLIGGGDPLLYTDDYAALFPRSSRHSRLEDLADRLVEIGVVQINGGIIANASRYDTQTQPSSWDPEGLLAEAGRTGPLSALMVNDGFATFPEVLEPGVFGSPADDSALQAAAIFDNLLTARGIGVAGGQRNEPELPADVIEIVSLESLSMAEIVTEMLTFSDNTTAELLLKELGFVTVGQGTTDAGALAALESMGGLGIDVSTMFISDGSGLSSRNRLSCSSVVDILNLDGLDSDLGRALAISGRTGTLRDRYENAPLRNVVHAKTGTLAGVSSLAGFIKTQPGEVVSFAFLMNLEPEIPDALLSLQDDMLQRLVRYPTGPPIEELLPLRLDRDAAAPYDSRTPGGSDDVADPTPEPPADDEGGGGGLGPDD